MGYLRELVKTFAWSRGFKVEAIARPGDVAQFLSKFRANYAHVELIRIGGPGDGGYLVPNDLEGIKTCFSPGVDVKASFEAWLAQTHGIRSFMADASVEAAPVDNPLFDFDPLYLGSVDDAPITTLESWMRDKVDLSAAGDMILQMDIERAEFPVLIETSRDVLRRFRIIVLEFHWMTRLFDDLSLPLVSAIFDKLFADFAVVHVHPNNVRPVVWQGSHGIPPTFEVTFLRRDRVAGIEQSGPVVLPHSLDAPNVSSKPDYAMPDCWWRADFSSL